ncbi:MAG: methionyl-tRNA formyltransferase [Phycisphaerae bacterium]|nr:methionyl-tRNA formyltransferase [Phycisphaerae bacterium]
MRIVLMASGAFALPSLRWLAQSGHDLPLVVTQPARGSGRGRKVTSTPVAQFAMEHELPFLEIEDVNLPEHVRRLKDLECRLSLVIAFGQKLGAEVRGAFPGGCINLHASLLPKYRGAAPINWAIVRGEERTGCSVFHIVERMDAGPILSSRWTYIKPEETAGELHDRLAGVGVDAVRAALEQFESGETPTGTPQNDAEATRAPKLKKSDGFVNFARPADEIARLICGMTPWPGATAIYRSGAGREETVTLVRARKAEIPGQPDHPPGTVDQRLCVAANDGLVEILEIRPSGGRVMTWPDFVNGRRVRPGDVLLTPESAEQT